MDTVCSTALSSATGAPRRLSARRCRGPRAAGPRSRRTAARRRVEPPRDPRGAVHLVEPAPPGRPGPAAAACHPGTGRPARERTRPSPRHRQVEHQPEPAEQRRMLVQAGDDLVEVHRVVRASVRGAPGRGVARWRLLRPAVWNATARTISSAGPPPPGSTSIMPVGPSARVVAPATSVRRPCRAAIRRRPSASAASAARSAAAISSSNGRVLGHQRLVRSGAISGRSSIESTTIRPYEWRRLSITVIAEYVITGRLGQVLRPSNGTTVVVGPKTVCHDRGTAHPAAAGPAGAARCRRTRPRSPIPAHSVAGQSSRSG